MHLCLIARNAFAGIKKTRRNSRRLAELGAEVFLGVGDLSLISNMSRQARNMHACWRIQRGSMGIDEMNLGCTPVH